MVETDLRLTKDGVVVLMHDPTVNRTTNGGNVKVSDLTFAQIETLDAGSWFGPQFVGEKVPSFDELLTYLSTLPHTAVIMDIKDHGIGKEIAAVVKKHKFEQRVTASCWTDADMLDISQFLNVTVKQLLGSYPTSRAGDDWIAQQRSRGYQSFSLQYSTIPPQFGLACQRNLIPLVLWTVDDTAVALSADQEGVTSIITNVPLVMKQALEGGALLPMQEIILVTLSVLSGILLLIVLILSFKLARSNRTHKPPYELHQ